ncbi:MULTISPECIES: hypothetical protein [Candidatus Ichthyocystis]|uniref:hypothetical protein n=1 Tax=Candidatus Ichthyocystis TaxID=2929841 RepID=UPI000A8D7346|nr:MULTISPECIES: hypothetical protein [Ichthyocystis]
MRPYSHLDSIDSLKINEEISDTTEQLGAASCSNSPYTPDLPSSHDYSALNNNRPDSPSNNTRSQHIDIIDQEDSKLVVRKAKSFNFRKLSVMFKHQPKRSNSLNEELRSEPKNTTSSSSTPNTSSIFAPSYIDEIPGSTLVNTMESQDLAATKFGKSQTKETITLSSLKNRVNLCNKKAKNLSDLVSVIIFLRSEIYPSYKKFSNSISLKYIKQRELYNLSSLCEISDLSSSKYSDKKLENTISKVESLLEKIEHSTKFRTIRDIEEETYSVWEKNTDAIYHTESIPDLCNNCYVKEEGNGNLEENNLSISELESIINSSLSELTELYDSIIKSALICRKSMILIAERIVYIITGINTRNTNKCISHINKCKKFTMAINIMIQKQAEIYSMEQDINKETATIKINLDQPSNRKLLPFKSSTATSLIQNSCLAKTLSGMNCIISSLYDWKNNESLVHAPLNNIGLNLIVDHSYAEHTLGSITRIISKKIGTIMGKELIGGIIIDASITTDSK